MKAHYVPASKGGLRVIRPLVHAREADLRAFARAAHLPVIEDNCPACFEAPLERARVKRLLAQQVSALRPACRPTYQAAAPRARCCCCSGGPFCPPLLHPFSKC